MINRKLIFSKTGVNKGKLNIHVIHCNNECKEKIKITSIFIKELSTICSPGYNAKWPTNDDK